MAMGILSGKYHLSDNCGPPDARMNLFKGRYSEGESRYKLQSPKVKAAVKEYTQISAKYGISPVTLAIAFVLRHPLVASAVFGATKLWQLDEVLQATTVHLCEEIVAEINDSWVTHRNMVRPKMVTSKATMSVIRRACGMGFSGTRLTREPSTF